MAFDLGDYIADIDTDSIEADSGRPAPVPVGDYVLSLDEKEIKENENTGAVRLACKFKVQEGEFAGRVIYNDYNIRNESADAQRIGIGQLKGFAEAAGVSWDTVKADTSALIGMPFIGRVGLSKVTAQYPEPRNEIKGYKSMAQGISAPPAGKAPPKAAGVKPGAARPGAAPAGGPKSRPWDRKPAPEGASA